MASSMGSGGFLGLPMHALGSLLLIQQFLDARLHHSMLRLGVFGLWGRIPGLLGHGHGLRSPPQVPHGNPRCFLLPLWMENSPLREYERCPRFVIYHNTRPQAGPHRPRTRGFFIGGDRWACRRYSSCVTGRCPCCKPGPASGCRAGTRAYSCQGIVIVAFGIGFGGSAGRRL